MTRRYGQVIQVDLADGAPARLRWRGETYRVAEILGRWRLRDRWWEAGSPSAGGDPTVPPPRAASDRSYYRLRCASGLLCEVYHDAASGHWILDRVLD